LGQLVRVIPVLRCEYALSLSLMWIFDCFLLNSEVEIDANQEIKWHNQLHKKQNYV
jgi:hypothetical protein